MLLKSNTDTTEQDFQGLCGIAAVKCSRNFDGNGQAKLRPAILIPVELVNTTQRAVPGCSLVIVCMELSLEPVMNFFGEKYVQGKYILGISLEWRKNVKDIRVM